MSTQLIPQDRHGNPYWGPRTFAEACELIDLDGDLDAATDVADSLDDAGYTGIARRVRKAYGVEGGAE